MINILDGNNYFYEGKGYGDGQIDRYGYLPGNGFGCGSMYGYSDGDGSGDGTDYGNGEGSRY